MSIVRLTGGLGNQLFQYAMSLSLAELTNQESILDSVEFRYRNRTADRKLEIGRFIQCKLINTPNLITTQLPTRVSRRIERKKMQLINGSVLENLPIFREAGTIYDPTLDLQPNKYYVGNFISHKYWKREPDFYFDSIYESMRRATQIKSRGNHSSIGIHVRRGDYLANPKVRDLHGYCSDDYFLEAVRHIVSYSERVRKVRISTDSVERIQDITFRIQEIGLEVEVIDSTDPIESLITLTENDYFVGSNSTFSWWASNLYPKKLRIFPSDWFLKNSAPFSLEEYFPTPVVGLGNALTSKPLVI